MQITTTPSIDGKRITRYCGIVTGEAILGANLFKDLFAGIRDGIGDVHKYVNNYLLNMDYLLAYGCPQRSSIFDFR